MKRYKPAMVNSETPWKNISVPMVQASMVECEQGGYIEYSPLRDAAPKMYAMLERCLAIIADADYDRFCDYSGGGEWSEPDECKEIEKLLAEARGEL